MAAKQGPMARAGRRFLRVAVVSLLAISLGPVGIAAAETPTVTIESPENGSVIPNATPLFSGSTEFLEAVTVEIKAGGALVQRLLTLSLPSLGGRLGFTWSAGPAEALPEGTYTASAAQASGTPSEPVTFTVDTKAPSVTLTYPADGSSTSSSTQVVSGSAGTEEGDLPTITIQLFSGPTTEQAHLEALTVQASNGTWAAAFGGLNPGTYTARAEQSDQAGNVGMSAPVTFTVTPPPSPSEPTPPAASFKWFPSFPKTGEDVSLVSTSTDSASPITAFAWALTGAGAFQPGKPLLTTSFSTPGGHVVQLRVTDAGGLSSVATETIPVTSAPLVLMQPFPVVRIAGSDTASGVRLSLLTVQAPVGARVTVTCKGRGCPTKSESRVAVSTDSKGGTFVVGFQRFERSLRAGVMLEIRVSRPGEIGKYTSFLVRRDRLPVRVDKCLGPTGINPIVCPSS
jgi:PKD domain